MRKIKNLAFVVLATPLILCLWLLSMVLVGRMPTKVIFGEFKRVIDRLATADGAIEAAIDHIVGEAK